MGLEPRHAAGALMMTGNKEAGRPRHKGTREAWGREAEPQTCLNQCAEDHPGCFPSALTGHWGGGGCGRVLHQRGTQATAEGRRRGQTLRHSGHCVWARLHTALQACASPQASGGDSSSAPWPSEGQARDGMTGVVGKHWLTRIQSCRQQSRARAQGSDPRVCIAVDGGRGGTGRGAGGEGAPTARAGRRVVVTLQCCGSLSGLWVSGGRVVVWARGRVGRHGHLT
jgi:hypothetical protein